MNVLTISLMSSCNQSCYYCPVKKWLVPIERTDINIITNAALLPWLDKYIDPREWVVELTGGEPGLYPEINELITNLADRGFYGMVKTNGSLPMGKTPAFPLITAWHKGIEAIPQYYDQIVIIENPDDNWREKVKYCKQKNVPYQTVLFDRQFEGQKTEAVYCKFNNTIAGLHINSSGQVTPCAAARVMPDKTIFNMAPPVEKELALDCPRCKNINDVERFLSER